MIRTGNFAKDFPAWRKDQREQIAARREYARKHPQMNMDSKKLGSMSEKWMKKVERMRKR